MSTLIFLKLLSFLFFYKNTSIINCFINDLLANEEIEIQVHEVHEVHESTDSMEVIFNNNDPEDIFFKIMNSENIHIYERSVSIEVLLKSNDMHEENFYMCNWFSPNESQRDFNDIFKLKSSIVHQIIDFSEYKLNYRGETFTISGFGNVPVSENNNLVLFKLKSCDIPTEFTNEPMMLYVLIYNSNLYVVIKARKTIAYDIFNTIESDNIFG